MKAGRNEQLIINAIEWAINVSEQATCDLIRGMEITSDELNFIRIKLLVCLNLMMMH